jgi:CheY-like chemotaxis protein
MSINILVADDDKTIANLIKEIVERRGSTALVAYDGEEAYKIFNNFKVDLLITDLKMPNVDGISLIKMIRQKDRAIPIIIITGYGSDENYEIAQRYGVTSFLSKPCSVLDITRAIESALNLS